MIRRAKPSDLEIMAELMMTEYERTFKEKWTKASAVKALKKYFIKSEIFTYVIDKKVIGFIIMHTFFWHDGARCFIDEIVISSKYQGKGYGKALVNYVEKVSRQRGAGKIELMAGEKTKAFKIYKKLGFKTTKDYVYMSKKLK